MASTSAICDADTRQVALSKQKLAKSQHVVVRFIEDNTYMEADRSVIVDSEIDILVNSAVKVIYDKRKNKAADAVLLFCGDAARAKFLEGKLSLAGQEEESAIVNGLEAEFSKELAINLQKRRRAVSVEEQNGKKQSKSPGLNTLAQKSKRNRFGLIDLDPDQTDVHLSNGFPPDERTMSITNDNAQEDCTGVQEVSTALRILANPYDWETEENAHLTPSVQRLLQSESLTTASKEANLTTLLFHDENAGNFTEGIISEHPRTHIGGLSASNLSSVDPNSLVANLTTGTRADESNRPRGEWQRNTVSISRSSICEPTHYRTGNSCTACQSIHEELRTMNRKLDVVIDLYRNLLYQRSNSTPLTSGLCNERKEASCSAVSTNSALTREIVALGEKANKQNQERPVQTVSNVTQSFALSDQVLEDLYLRKASSYTQYSLELLKHLFTKEERLDSNVYGRNGKRPLSPKRVAYLRNLVKKTYFPMTDEKLEEKNFSEKWRVCVNAINGKLNRELHSVRARSTTVNVQQNSTDDLVSIDAE